MIAASIPSVFHQLSTVSQTATDHLAAQRATLDVIQTVVPFDAGSFATVDPASVLWTSCVLHGIERDPAREYFMFDNEYRQTDLLKISDLARQANPVGRLSATDPRVRASSPRFQALQEFGVVDELRCAIVDHGHCWASFDIFRGKSSGVFTRSEERTISSLVPALARMIRLVLLRQAATIPGIVVDDAPGVVVLDGNGNIRTKSPSSDRWLEELTPAGAATPPALRALAMRLATSTGEEFSTTIQQASGGQLRLHAAALRTEDDTPLFSIVVEPARAPVVSNAIVQTYGLTPREREIISWMARGLSTKEIALQLGISQFTVNDHAKAIFHKAGVQSRQKLIALLFFDHCLPMRELGATPGPYGWFLHPTDAS